MITSSNPSRERGGGEKTKMKEELCVAVNLLNDETNNG